MPIIAHQNQIIGQATNAEALVKDTVGWTGKNRLKNEATTQTKNGVTFTVNADKSVTVNGTVTTGYNPELFLLNKTTSNKHAGCILSCGVSNTSDVYMRIRIGNSSTGTYIREIKGDNIIIPTLESGQDYYIAIRCADGTTINNLTFYPMLRKADITDPTYEPYHESVEEEIEQIYADNGVLGAKNLLKSKNTFKTVTTAGITFTVNDDGSITANGTATADAFYEYVKGANDVLEKGKSYIASTGQTANGGLHVYYKVNNSDTWIQLVSAVNEEKEFFLPSNANFILIRMFIGNGNTVSNKVYYPMLRLASDPDDTYQPYAMTNRELTEELTVKQSEISTSLSTTLNVLRKYGKVVTFSFRSTNTTGSVDDEIGIIPDGFRPANNCTILAGITDGASKRITIAPNSGKVAFADPVTNTTLTIHTTWITS